MTTTTRVPGRRIRLMLAIDGLGIGGAEMVVRDLARNLNRDEFELSICCTKGLGPTGRELAAEGFDIFALPTDEHRVDYLTGLKMRRAIKSRRVDIVHTHAAPALFDAALSRLLLSSVKVVHTFHFGNYPYDSWRYHQLESFCAGVVDRLVAVGAEQRLRIADTYGIGKSRIGLVWNGVPGPAGHADAAFRTSVCGDGQILVGTVAKLIEQKGLDDLLRVARLCKDRGYPMKFAIVGEGPLRGQLEELRHSLGLDEDVTITGWIPNAADRVVPTFDVFFQPSRWEAMSIAVLEAMARCKAIVATRVGDNGHVLEHGSSGLLVERGDVQALADALGQLTAPEARAALGHNARARFEHHFTLPHMVGAYARLYRELAA